MPGGSSGGTSYSSQNSNTQTDMGPWSQQQPFLTAGWNGAKNLNGSNPLNSPMNGAQTGALSQIQQMGLQPNQTVGDANSTLDKYINGSMLSPNSNPYLSGMEGAAAQQVTNQYQTATAPQTDSAFEKAGRYGSGSANQAVNQNQLALGNTLGNLANNFYGTAYQKGTQQQLLASGLAPGLNQAQYLNPTAALNAGNQQQNLQLQTQMQPWQQAALYQALIGAPTGQSGSSSTQSSGTQQTPYNSSPLGSIFGGLLGAAGTAGQLGWSPFGAAAGAAGAAGGAGASFGSIDALLPFLTLP